MDLARHPDGPVLRQEQRRHEQGGPLPWGGPSPPTPHFFRSAGPGRSRQFPGGRRFLLSSSFDGRPAGRGLLGASQGRRRGPGGPCSAFQRRATRVLCTACVHNSGISRFSVPRLGRRIPFHCSFCDLSLGVVRLGILRPGVPCFGVLRFYFLSACSACRPSPLLSASKILCSSISAFGGSGFRRSASGRPTCRRVALDPSACGSEGRGGEEEDRRGARERGGALEGRGAPLAHPPLARPLLSFGDVQSSSRRAAGR